MNIRSTRYTLETLYIYVSRNGLTSYSQTQTTMRWDETRWETWIIFLLLSFLAAWELLIGGRLSSLHISQTIWINLWFVCGASQTMICHGNPITYTLCAGILIIWHCGHVTKDKSDGNCWAVQLCIWTASSLAYTSDVLSGRLMVNGMCRMW